MKAPEQRIILASASPRRRELLGMFSLPFTVCPALGEEAPPPHLTPEETVRALARAKADEVAGRVGAGELILAADTIVELEGELLGKPGSPEAAGAMLRRLSGREHRVYSGLCLRRGERVLEGCEMTRVRFRPLGDREIDAYVATGEPLDKAGAYGYQGRASLFVEGIEGDFFNVMGLPLCRLGRMLKELGVELL